jgi:hypothetical protein
VGEVGDGSSIGPNELTELQRAVLTAVLEGRPLPGRDVPVELPDLPLVAGGPVVLLAEENLAGPPGDVIGGKRIRVAPEREIAAGAGATGDIAYLVFGPPETAGEDVLFRLDARLASATSGAPTLGLSGMVLRARRTDEGWRAVDEPAFYAT